MVKKILILIIIFSCQLLSQSAQETIIKASKLRYSDPKQAIELLVNKHDFINQLDNESVFSANFELFQLYIKLGQKQKAERTLKYMEKRLANLKTYLSWIALMKVQNMIINQKHENVDSTLASFTEELKEKKKSKINMWYSYLTGIRHVNKNQYKKAFETLTQALSLAENYNDYLVRLGVLDQFVNIFYYMQDYSKSLEYSKKALKISRTLNDRFSEVRALSSQMNIYYMMSTQQQRVVNNASTEELKSIESKKLDEYFKKTRELQNSVLSLSRDIGAFHFELRALIMLMNQLENEKKYKEAVKVSERAVELAKKNNLTYEQAVSYNNMAISLRLLGEHEKGLSALKKAEKLYKALKIEQSLLWILEDYSIAYQINGQFKKALEFYKKYNDASMKLLKKTNNKTVLELQEKFESKKKEREIEKLNEKNRLHSAELEAEKANRLLFIGFIIALFIVVALQYNRSKIIREKNLKLDLLNEKLKELSFKDPLTGLNNRRLLQEVKDKIINNALRRVEKYPVIDSSIGIILFDIDHFKKVNDSYGHDIGDKVICHFADDITRNLRKEDFAIRWGGEEFLIIMFNVNEEIVEKYCKRMIYLRNETEIETNAIKIKVSTSIGYSVFPFSKKNPKWLSWEESLKLVDNLLYFAKKSGRNKAATVSIAEDALNNEIKNQLIIKSLDSEEKLSTKINIKKIVYENRI